jgi:hypothetical protein
MLATSFFAAAYQPLTGAPARTIVAGRGKADAGPFPDRHRRRAVMAGCHYFSPVFVGLQEPAATVLQL